MRYGAKITLAPEPTGEPGIGPGLVGQVGLRGGDSPVLVRAHLDPDIRARGRAGRRQHFGAAHGHLHRAVPAFFESSAASGSR